MVEIKVRITERQLAEMDRMLQRKGIHGNQWLKDAVCIYKAILASRRARYDTPGTSLPRIYTSRRLVKVG